MSTVNHCWPLGCTYDNTHAGTRSFPKVAARACVCVCVCVFSSLGFSFISAMTTLATVFHVKVHKEHLDPAPDKDLKAIVAILSDNGEANTGLTFVWSVGFFRMSLLRAWGRIWVDWEL